MERVFVYGTLQNAEVQKRVVGREIAGRKDVLDGYVKGTTSINGNEYFIANKSPTAQLSGKVLEVASEELARMDEYETAAYIRELVILRSGLKAWVYCKP